jgi:hypothetical protein
LHRWIRKVPGWHGRGRAALGSATWGCAWVGRCGGGCMWTWLTLLSCSVVAQACAHGWCVRAQMHMQTRTHHPTRTHARTPRTPRTTQQQSPIRWCLLSERLRNVTAKNAAKSISAPRIIWYTDAVTHSSPTFMSTVASRSKNVGMPSMSTSLSSLRLGASCGGGEGGPEESCRGEQAACVWQAAVADACASPAPLFQQLRVHVAHPMHGAPMQRCHAMPWWRAPAPRQPAAEAPPRPPPSSSPSHQIAPSAGRGTCLTSSTVVRVSACLVGARHHHAHASPCNHAHAPTDEHKGRHGPWLVEVLLGAIGADALELVDCACVSKHVHTCCGGKLAALRPPAPPQPRSPPTPEFAPTDLCEEGGGGPEHNQASHRAVLARERHGAGCLLCPTSADALRLNT